MSISLLQISPSLSYALLWLVALACALMPLAGYEAEAAGAAIMILSAGLCFIVLKHPVESIPPRAVIIPAALLGALWLTALLSVLTSAIPSVSFIYFCIFSALPVSFLWALLLRPARFGNAVDHGLGLLALVLALSALFQYFYLPDALFYGRVHWPFANPNALGAMLSLLGILSLGQVLSAPAAGRRKYFYAVVSALVLLGLLSTGSRGAILALAAGAIPAALLLRVCIRRESALPGFAALFAAGCALMFFAHAPGAMAPGDTLRQTAAGDYPALWASPALWRGTAAMIRDHLWAGTGIGTFFLYYPQYRGADFYTAGLMAHNDPLQFWAEMGLAAPVLFYALCGAGIFYTWRALRILDPGDPRRVQLMVPALALFAMILHAHVTYNFYLLPCLMLGGLLAGRWLGVIAEIMPKVRATPVPEKIRLTLKTFTIAGSCAALFFFCMLQGGVILTRQAQQAAEAGDIDLFARRVNQAGRMSQGQDPGAFILAASVPLNVLENKDAALPETARHLLAEQALGYLSKAGALNPRQPDILYYRARALKADGHIPQAQTALMQALNIDPSYLSARQMLADLYAGQAHKDKALALLADGLQWTKMPKDSRAFLEQLAMISLEQGDMQTHASAMRALKDQVVTRVNKTGIARNAYSPRGAAVLDIPN